METGDSGKAHDRVRFDHTVSQLLDGVDACIYLKDMQGRYLYANQAMADLFKINAEELLGQRDDRFLDVERSVGLAEENRVIAEGEKIEGDYEIYLTGGERYILHTIRVPLHNAQKAVIGVCGMSIELTSLEHNTDPILSDHQLLSTILSHVDASIFLKSSDGRYLFANPKVLELYGRPLAEVLGRTDDELLDSETASRVREIDRTVLMSTAKQVHEEVLADAGGSGKHYFWTTKMPLHVPGQGICLLGIATEITELLRLRHLVEHQEQQRITDGLTGLPNRLLFESTIDSWLKHQPDTKFAVAIFDIDQFRYLNNSLGQAAGDRLLQQIGRRLQQCCPAAPYVARLSGDEFAVAMPFKDQDGLADTIDALRSSVSQPYSAASATLHLSVSTGISIAGQDGNTAALLLAAAEAALYSAKELGRDQYRFYSSVLRSNVIERADLERDLRTSVGTDQYELFYQPKVNSDGKIVGVEALLRWHRPRSGFTTPEKFIPLAEQLGLLLPIGRWVINEACQRISEWKNLGLEAVPIAVNLSAVQLATDEIIEYVSERLHYWNVPESLLELELTESMMMLDPDSAVARLGKLRALGITLSIDDFGTGFSSMAYLRQLPVHCLKIDKSFVLNIAADERDADLCDGIMSLAHMLNMTVIAEGVETVEQFEILKARRCDMFQGYFFSKPVSNADIVHLMQQSPLALSAKVN